MPRLDKVREAELTPVRKEFAKNVLRKMGYSISYEDDVKIKFIFKGEPVTFFAYSGWYTGKTIKDGRGFQNLLNQLD